MLYRQMQVFVEVANCLSFTKAAHNLYMSQQAVTKQIAALEKEIGVTLLHRTTRTVELTEAGRMLRDDFTDINKRISDSVHRVQMFDEADRESITIGFLSALSGTNFIAPIMNQLIQSNAQLFFDIQLLDFTDLRNRLLDAKIDICVSTCSDWQLWPGVSASVMKSSPFYIVYSKNLALAQETFTMEKLKQYDQLVLPEEILMSGAQSWWDKIPCRDIIRTPDVQTMLVRLESGQGFAILTKDIVADQTGNLMFQSTPFEDANADLVCITRKDRDSVTEEIAGQIEYLVTEKELITL